MDKRKFIKTISLGTLAVPLYTSAFSDAITEIANIPPKELASTDDFWEKVRQDYKLKPDYINLESGYYNIIPTPTLNKMIEHAQMVNYEGSYYMRTVQWDNKKRMADKLAKLVGCQDKNVIITRNTTESLDMVIKGMNWQAGDEAVFAEQDYGAMKMMFKQVSERYRVINKIVSVPNHPKSDEEIVELYANAITPKTKLLMVCHMINITGQILPIKKICQMAHEKGVQVMVDGAHCVGHFEFSIEELECDYYGSSLHKWLAVPLGTGLLYVKDEHIDTLWPIFAEHEREPGDISRLNHTGTIPVYHDLSIENAIDYYNILGGTRKEERLRYLQEYWTSKIRNNPNIVINTPADSHRACGIANVGIKGMKPAELAKRLMQEYKIFTVAIDYANVQGCRITPNVFTLTSELDVFVNALEEMAA
ncbi:MAG: aminotransferase class V-fold PLP-dependent enzyme [Flavobacteriaceae bacterium]|nr:aminotransferase class V-fold PLP-dependent enzyme [Bacteroidia bacterium]NND11820.1 aminotransferase class V-fold PLP-dependent enzyme [Flavobacteriaceae bacterium]NNL61588.1 aminotransferase class V-fold PLP-dependent enzyme [Flavobacteriaceae bacterium]RZV68028.1 MAG: aminotransferase class V-fold PLP-dependent enzyme [Flavobacteriaceae bacterium]